MSTSLEKVARRLLGLEREVRNLKQPQLAYSSVEDGSVDVNIGGQRTMVIGLQYDGTSVSTTLTGPTPPVPTTPLVTPGPHSLRIYWDGTWEDALVAPLDFARVSVHAVPTDEFIGYDPLDQTRIVGFIPQATGGEITASLPAEEHVVYLVAWSLAGKFSLEAIATFGTPTLVADAENLTPLQTHLDAVAAIESDIQETIDAVAAGDTAISDALDTEVATRIAQLAAANAAIDTVQDDATEALALAAAAQNAADGAIRTYFQATPPWPDGSSQPASSLGDLWWDSDNDIANRWNGTTWQIIQDDAIATALANANSALSLAGTKVTTYTTTTTPTPPTGGFTVGDLWLSPGNRILRWSGSAWVGLQFGEAAFVSDIRAALGQLFIDDFRDTESLRRWNGGSTAPSHWTIVSPADAEFGATVFQATNIYTAAYHQQRIPFDPNQLYRVTVRARGVAGAPKLYAGVRLFKADGSASAGGTSGNWYGAASSVNVPVGAAYTEYVGYFKGYNTGLSSTVGTGITDPGKISTDVAYFAPMMLPAYNAVAGDQMQVSLYKVEAVPTGQVARANILNLAVGTAQIDDLAVNNAKIADLSVTDAKVSGLLSASKIQISGSSTYASGYDPSTKETPTGAQAKATAAQTAAISAAATDATSKANTAQSNAISTAAADATSKANIARTGAVGDLKTLWGAPSDTTLIDGGKLFTRSVATDKLLVSDFTNYAVDPYANTAASWTLDTGFGLSTTTALSPAGTNTVLRFSAAGMAGFNRNAQLPALPVRPLDKFRLVASGRKQGTSPTIGSLRVGIWFHDSTGSYISASYASMNATAMANLTWYEFSADIEAPANARSMRISVQGVNVDNGIYDFTDFQVRRRFGGELLVDGSVLARHVGADLVESLLVTGNVLQTDAAEDRGIKISTGGIIVYDSEADSPTLGEAKFIVDPRTALVSARDGRFVGGSFETRDVAGLGIKVGLVDGVEGLYAYDDNGKPFLTMVPSQGASVTAGETRTQSLTVSSDDPDSPAGSSLGGVTEIATGGKVLLTSGTTAPKSAPTVTTGYDQLQFEEDWSGNRGLAYDGTHYYTTRALSSGTFGRPAVASLQLARYDTTGAFLTNDGYRTEGNFGASVSGGVALYGSYAYTLAQIGSNTWYVHKWDKATMEVVDTAVWTGDDATGKVPAIGVDPATGELLIAQSRASNGDKVRIRRYTFGASVLTAGAQVDTTTGFAQDLGGVWYGTADFGAARYVVTNSTGGDFRPLSVSGTDGTFIEGERWPLGATSKVGFAHNGTAFISLDIAGVRRTYTSIWSTTDANMTKWVSNTLAMGSTPTYQTDQSPRTKIVVPKRSKLIVSTSGIPSGTDPTKDPDRVRIFVGQGTTDPGRTAMALQTSPAAGVTTAQYSSLTAPPGTNPPATPGTFPGGSGSTVESAATNGSGVPHTRIKNDGTVRMMKFHQRGTVHTDTLVAGTFVDIPVTFDVPFDAPPVITTSIKDAGGSPLNFGSSPRNVTATGFDLRVIRATGTTAMDVCWDAGPATQ